jgi:hypothetical protein
MILSRSGSAEDSEHFYHTETSSRSFVLPSMFFSQKLAVLQLMPCQSENSVSAAGSFPYQEETSTWWLNSTVGASWWRRSSLTFRPPSQLSWCWSILWCLQSAHLRGSELSTTLSYLRDASRGGFKVSKPQWGQSLREAASATSYDAWREVSAIKYSSVSLFALSAQNHFSAASSDWLTASFLPYFPRRSFWKPLGLIGTSELCRSSLLEVASCKMWGPLISSLTLRVDFDGSSKSLPGSC